MRGAAQNFYPDPIASAAIGQITTYDIVRAAPATAIDIRQCDWRRRGVS
jgi:hypothetical protein